MDTSLQKINVHSLRQAISRVLYLVQKDSTSRRPTYPRIEAQVEKDLIPTLLAALGWDVRDSSHVLAKPEIRSTGKRPDFLLKGPDGDVIIIEAKALGSARLELKDNESQVKEYLKVTPMVYLTDGVIWRSFCRARENGVGITLSATPPKLVEEFFLPLDHDMDMKSRLNHYQHVYKKLEQWEYDLVMALTDDLAEKIDITGYLQAFVMTEVRKRLSPPFGGLLSERNLTELVEIKVWHLQGEIGRRICDYRYRCEFSDENA